MASLLHSAEGSTWKKRNHKYIRKEGNRYIYPEDLQKTRRGGGGPINRDENKGSGRSFGATNTVKGSGRDFGEKSIKGSGRSFEFDPLKKRGGGGAIQRTKEKTAREIIRERQMIDKRADAINNQRSADYKAISKNNAFEQRARKRLRDSIERSNKAQAERAKENRLNSATGRTARDVISEKGTKRVMYQNGRNENGTPVRARRSVGVKTGYDDRGFKTNEYRQEDVVRQTARTPKSGTARDIINKKGTQRVSYNEDKTGTLKRTVTNKDYSKTTTEVKRSSLEKRKARGKRVIDQYLEKKQMEKLQKRYEKQKAKIEKKAEKEKEKARKQARRELEKQIPASMKWKRDKKRIKRFFTRK